MMCTLTFSVFKVQGFVVPAQITFHDIIMI